jgi:hypothetical protein
VRRWAGRLLALLAIRLYYLPAIVLGLADAVAGGDALELTPWLEPADVEEAAA